MTQESTRQDDTKAKRSANIVEQMRKGMLTLALLQVVSGSRVFAGEILQKLADTGFATGEGTLYPLLSRLKREGLFEYEWVESKSGPPRKYYKLSSMGEAMRQDLLKSQSALSKELKKLGEQ